MTRRFRKTPSGHSTATPFVDVPYVPEAGSVPFPGYRLLRLRGRGGFATVWEATNPAGEHIAMKFMSSGNASSTAREVRSIQAVQKLTHPNLLHTRDVWCIPGNIVIAMDLADASLLDLFLLYADEFQTPVDAKRVCIYLYKTAQALDFLNARKHIFEGRSVGFQHGDIKPNNILLVGDEPMLADYGLATPMHGTNTPCPRQGTMEYAAPEVFHGTLSDTSDQFSLAVSYYLLRAGAFPFPPPPRVASKGYMRPPPDLSLVTPDEQKVLQRALSTVPQDRFPTCMEFMQRMLVAMHLVMVHDPIIGWMVQEAKAGSNHLSQPSRSMRIDSV
jgi:serine/threonine protein kinase